MGQVDAAVLRRIAASEEQEAVASGENVWPVVGVFATALVERGQVLDIATRVRDFLHGAASTRCKQDRAIGAPGSSAPVRCLCDGLR